MQPLKSKRSTIKNISKSYAYDVFINGENNVDSQKEPQTQSSSGIHNVLEQETSAIKINI